MGLFDALFGFGSSAMTSAMNWAMSREAMNTQYENQRKLNIQSNELSKDYTQWLNTNAYSQQRTGLENAGYNPMLAVGASPMSGNISGGSAGLSSAQASDLSGSVTNAYRAFRLERDKTGAEVNQLKASEKATNASVSLIDEQAKTEQYRQKQMEADTALSNINKMLADKQVKWYDKEALMRIKTGYLNATANHLASEAQQLNAHTAQAQYRLQKGVTDYENVNRKALADWINKNKGQYNWTTGIGRWTGAFGNIFSGLGSNLLKK